MVNPPPLAPGVALPVKKLVGLTSLTSPEASAVPDRFPGRRGRAWHTPLTILDKHIGAGARLSITTQDNSVMIARCQRAGDVN